jgi:hypothetical protein
MAQPRSTPKRPRVEEPPPRDGGGPAPELPPRPDPREPGESREEKPHAPSTSAVPPDPDKPFC